MRIRVARIDDAPSIARVHVDTWRTTYSGIVPAEYLANLSYERSAAGYIRRFESGVYSDSGEVLLISEDADAGTIGFVIGGTERDKNRGYEGEIYAIYVLRNWQQKGLGRLLFSEMADMLLQRGMKSLLIWVLSENKSRAFYESIGGVLVGEKDIVIGGKTLKEVAYGWPDLSVFLKGPDVMDAKKA